jgi:formyltetrahydrofolate-dependent phosphoribosylglycinamide formyltransferase
MTARIAVLASGGGSNLHALLDHLATLGDRAAGRVALVASDRPDAGALERARHASIPTATIDPRASGDALLETLARHDADLIVLAGYLKLVPAEVTARFRGRTLNVHPSLLPAFGGPGMYGRRVHEAVLRAGARVSGATVHFVDEAYDRGPIAAQWPVPVSPDDTPDALAGRVLRVEHALYPRVVDAVAGGRIALDARGRVRGGPPLDDGAAFALGPDAARAIADLFDAQLVG